MAEVWAAQLIADAGFCKSIVIKRVLPELAENPTFLRMLMSEARVAARLSHTNICSVFELGQVEGEAYIAMEYLRGATLGQLLGRGGAIAPAAACEIVAQACNGLHYAHEQRDANGASLELIHRDISPQNLFVSVGGIVKVLDFGIAKIDDGWAERTEAGKVKGKLGYMAPEQLVSHEKLDRRCDVWALGVVLWELLTGRRLFHGPRAATIDAICAGRVPPLADHGLALPALDAALARALCRREWRYATTAELRQAIVAAIAPQTLAHPDALDQLLWSRASDKVRETDRLFADDADEYIDTIDETRNLRIPPICVPVHVLTTEPLERVALEEKTVTGTGELPESTAPESIDEPPHHGRRLLAGLAGAAIGTVAALLIVGPGGDAHREASAAVVEPVATTPPPGPLPAPPPEPVIVPLPAEPEIAKPASPVPDDVPPKRTPPKKPGVLHVDADPWAVIYVDGDWLGETPIVGASVPAGDHTLRAVTGDGRERSMRFHVSSGGTVRRRVTW